MRTTTVAMAQNPNPNHTVASTAAVMLQKAVTYDNEKNYSQALVYYQEGIQFLIDVMKESQNIEERNLLKSKIEGYMTRAEVLKEKSTLQKNQCDTTRKNQTHVEVQPKLQHQQIIIEDNSTGHSYGMVFGKYLNEDVTEIEIEDPYIRIFHQCQNFLRFCELAVKSCGNLKRLSLLTCEDKAEQRKWLSSLQLDLSTRFRMELVISYSTTLHDREIRLNNGWVIKIGRGLDYFKNADKFTIGYHDQDLRKCHATTVDIFHREFVKKSYG